MVFVVLLVILDRQKELAPARSALGLAQLLAGMLVWVQGVWLGFLDLDLDLGFL